jgi:hypothetical protein
VDCVVGLKFHCLWTFGGKGPGSHLHQKLFLSSMFDIRAHQLSDRYEVFLMLPLVLYSRRGDFLIARLSGLLKFKTRGA